MTFHKSPGSTSLSRRAFLKVTGGGAAALLLAACAAPTGQPAAESGDDDAGASADAQISLSFWTPGGSQVYCEGFETIAQNYEEQNPNINIEEAQCGAGEQNFNEVLLARIAAGDPPDATILWTSPAAFGARNALIELDELMAGSQYSQKEAWPEGVLASCIFNGKTYGLPVAAGTYAIFYNEEWFEEKGLSSAREDFPKTWDELRALSKEFTTWNGDTLETAGFIPWDDDQYTLPIWSALNGSQLYDAENQQYTLDNDANLAMMEYGMAWLDEEYQGDINKVNVSGNWGGGTDAEGRPSNFSGGKLAMHVQGFWYCGDIYANEMQFERWNVASFPVGPGGSQTTSGYWPNWLVVPRGSRNPEEAFNYLDYMSAEGIKVWFSNIPDLPTNSNVPTDIYPQLTADKRGVEFAQEVTDFFRGQLDIATPMWNSPVQDFADDQIGRMLEQVYTKTATPAAALAEAQQACQTELENLLQQNA
jgi:ABC-type glycerol-3-phosphate transport system substrate-binding protein